jgi:hypothetical protein
MNPFPTARFAPLTLAVLLVLSACGGGGSESSTPTPTVTPMAPAVTALNASNATASGVASYKLALDVFGTTTVAANQLKSEPSSSGSTGTNVLGVALQAVQGLFSGEAGALVTKGAVVGKVARDVTELCDSGRVVSTYDDVNGNQVLDAGDTGTVRFEKCVLKGIRLSGSLTLAVNTISSTDTVQSADVTFTFVDLASTDLTTNQTASADGDLRVSTRLTYPTASATVPVSLLATYSGSRLVSTLRGEARTLSNYNGGFTVTPASNRYTFQLAGSVSSSSLPGVVTLSTPTAIEGTLGGEVRAGVIVATASDGSLVRLSVTPPSGGKVELDTNADGTPEVTSLLTREQLTAP